MASRMREGVESLKISHPASPVSQVVTISLGVATIKSPSHTIPPSWLVRQADMALYQAKTEGRNRCVLAQKSSIGTPPQAEIGTTSRDL